ncbi:MAG: aryl-sulfate sulfotransferase [Candidatus Thorarchaeota archaeon]
MERLRDTLITLLLIALILSGVGITIILVSISGGSSNNEPGVTIPTGESSIHMANLTSPLYGGITFDITKADGYLDGYNLFVLPAIDANLRSHRLENSLVIFDMDGNLILENPDIAKPVEMINSTTILGDGSGGAVLWNLETDQYQYLNIQGHHEYEYNPNDNTIFTLILTSEEIDGEEYRFDKVIEYSFNGSLVWSLDVHDFVDYTQWCPYEDRSKDRIDVTHSNSIFYDADEDVIFLNVRNVNTFYKIDHATGEVIWALGEYGDFTLFDRFGQERTNLFYHAHSLEQIDDDRFILFDNDFHNQTAFGSKRSRILEIEIDEETMTAQEIWTWTGDASYYSAWWGDADRLANGNRLGTFGTEVREVGPYGARLVEVNEDGEIVWEMSFRNTEDVIYGVYRMERIRFSPILSSHTDILISDGTDLNLSWQAWYNFRPKRTLPGSYELYIDDSLTAAGTIEFDKFWRSVDIDMNIGVLNIGNHNVTLTVQDEAGHTTSDSVNVSVRAFHVDRTGPLVTEIGSPNQLIVWSGVTSYSVSYELSANGTLLEQATWDGTDIMLNLTLLSTGRYHITLVFTNSSGTVYSDSFWVVVNPSAAPEFYISPSDTSIDWNTTTTMSWSVFDRSATDWVLYQNGKLKQFGSWSGGNHDIVWNVSDIDEGVYNITMVLQDIALNVVSHTTWLDVIPPSPPVLTDEPSSAMIEWAKKTVEYKWEVHGGTRWMLFRNGTLLRNEAKQDPTITLRIHDWQADGWRLGNYNITLLITDGSYSVSSTIWLSIFVDFGDAYADSVVASRSAWFSNGDQAIGVPDNAFASIYEDYAPGYLTLDMGENEEILNEAGIDFEVFSSGGNYAISVSPDLDQPFIELGVFSGTHSFDLESIEYNTVRYIRLELRDIEVVLLDAIVALNYEEQGSDTERPQITHIDNLEIWTNQIPYEIEWDVYDMTPWNYSIYINGNLKLQGSWNGDDIVYPFRQAPGEWEVSLVIFDLFGNNASSTVVITLKLTTSDVIMMTILSSSGILVFVVVAVYLWKRRSRDV